MTTISYTIESCVDAFCIDRENKELVCIKRLNDPEGLALVGGRKESGETLSEAVLREVFEETGYVGTGVPVPVELFSSPFRHPGKHRSSVLFIVPVAGPGHAGEDGKTEVVRIPLVEVLATKDDFIIDHGDMVLSALEILKRDIF